MAYKINRDDEHIVLPDGPVTAREVRKLMKQKKNPEFYELEAAEVIEVWLDEEDLPELDDGTKNWKKYGHTRVRMVISNDGAHDTIIVGPLDSNIQDFPYPGEYVIVVEYFGKKFYSQKLSLFNNVDSNILPGLSKEYNPFSKELYKENLPSVTNNKIRQLKAEEGDITFNGRFGNSIRLGSNVKEILTTDGVEENTGKENSPNVIIRAGQGYTYSGVKHKPVVEDINLDGSSIWMTTDQKVNIKLDNAHSTYIGPERGPDGFGGNRITINSDGLIFNSKKNNILMSSMGFIGLSANTEIALEVPNDTGKVYLGSGMADEPALGGDATMDLLEKLITALETFATTIRGAKGTVVDFIVPLSDIIEGASGLQGSLGKLKKRLNEPKSKTVRVGHMRGPE